MLLPLLFDSSSVPNFLLAPSNFSISFTRILPLVASGSFPLAEEEAEEGNFNLFFSPNSGCLCTLPSPPKKTVTTVSPSVSRAFFEFRRSNEPVKLGSVLTFLELLLLRFVNEAALLNDSEPESRPPPGSESWNTTALWKTLPFPATTPVLGEDRVEDLVSVPRRWSAAGQESSCNGSPR